MDFLLLLLHKAEATSAGSDRAEEHRLRSLVLLTISIGSASADSSRADEHRLGTDSLAMYHSPPQSVGSHLMAWPQLSLLALDSESTPRAEEYLGDLRWCPL